MTTPEGTRPEFPPTIPPETGLSADDLFNHFKDIGRHTDIRLGYPSNEAVDRFRATFGPIVED